MRCLFNSRPLHNPFSTPLYELFDPSAGLLAKSQKLGLTGSNSLGFAHSCGPLPPLNFPEGTLFNGVNFARQTDQTNQTKQTKQTRQTKQTKHAPQKVHNGRSKELCKRLNSYFLSFLFFLIPLFFPLSAPAEQSAMNYFVDGVEAFDRGDYNEAVRSLEKAIQLKPSNLEFRYYLGLSYGALNRNEKALKIFSEIVDKEPVKFRKAYFEIAALYSKQKEYQKAIDTLTLAEKAAPSDARIYLEKGYAYKNLKSYEQAIVNFKKAKELDPDLAQVACYNIAVAYYETDRFDMAEEMFLTAIASNPETATAENARQSIRNLKGAKRARRPWYLSTSLSWGYDDNVLLQALEQAGVVSATGEVLDKSDDFETIVLRGGYKFINRKDLEIGAGYTLYCTGYKELVDSNVLGHIPYLYLQYNDDPVYYRIEYDFSYYYAGGSRNDQDNGLYLTFGDSSEDKMRMHSLMPTITIVEPYGLRSEITLNYQDKHYLDGVTSNARHYIGGIVQSYKLPDSECYPRVGYKYGYEDATSKESTYQYHEGLVGFSSPLRWGVWGDVSLSYTRTYYHKNTRYCAEGERADKKYMFSASLSRTITDRFQFLFSYNYTHNNSNVMWSDGSSTYDPFKFKKNVYTLSINAVF